MNRLNGWQRIWIVLTVLWGLVVAAFAVATFPDSVYHYNESRSDEVVAAMRTKTWDMGKCPTVWEYDRDWLKVRLDLAGTQGRVQDVRGAVFYSDATRTTVAHRVRFVSFNERLVALCAGASVSEGQFDVIAKDYENAYYRVLRNERVKYVGGALLVWLVPALVLYALGLAFGWIRKGFKQS